MPSDTIRDRFWLWGMKVNVLQEATQGGYDKLNMPQSTMTVEDAIRKTGSGNIFMAGGLQMDVESLESMPSAQRIICKSDLHRFSDDGFVVNYDKGLTELIAAKRLASADARIEGFHIDDFSTGGIDAGIKPEHLARLQFANAVNHPHLPLSATIYTMSIDRPELPPLLPYFDRFLVSLWQADQIDTVPANLSHLSDLSGGKPAILCLYVFDFGTGKPISHELMRRSLDLAEKLLVEERIAGLLVCGTCMMDLDWESNRCLFSWLDQVGDRGLPSRDSR